MTDEISLIDGLARKQADMTVLIQELIDQGGANPPDLEMVKAHQAKFIDDIEALRQRQIALASTGETKAA